MIDIGEKKITKREATAKGEVFLSRATLQLIKKGEIPKGDVLNCAQVAGILAAKKTPHLIPMCHPLKITNVKVDFKLGENTRFFIFPKEICQLCMRKGECCAAKSSGRTITIGPNEKYLQKMRARQ